MKYLNSQPISYTKMELYKNICIKDILLWNEILYNLTFMKEVNRWVLQRPFIKTFVKQSEKNKRNN